MKSMRTSWIFGLIGSALAGYLYSTIYTQSTILLALLGLIGPLMFFAAFRGKLKNQIELGRYVRSSALTGILGILLVHAYFLWWLSQNFPGEQLFYFGDVFFLFLTTAFAYGLSNKLGERLLRR
ncbi:MAG: hypothetical protein QF460_01780 [Candidatus Nanoarchaeia archaeon]|jgi:hypothetical protein|nr:hypothetical protein [Candidatus Nanoarchaeia archaeon]